MNNIMNGLGSGFLFAAFMVGAWALTHWPMSFERAAAIVALVVLAEIRWHQTDKRWDAK